jgi:hypothetical protein
LLKDGPFKVFKETELPLFVEMRGTLFESSQFMILALSLASSFLMFPLNRMALISL